MGALPPAVLNFIIGLLVLIIAIVLGQLSWIGVESEKKAERRTVELIEPPAAQLSEEEKEVIIYD